MGGTKTRTIKKWASWIKQNKIKIKNKKHTDKMC